MNRFISIIMNRETTGIVGTFVGFNIAVYNDLKRPYCREDILHTTISAFMGGCIGGATGVLFPPIVPVYVASIPCYFGMKYLIKKELI